MERNLAVTYSYVVSHAGGALRSMGLAGVSPTAGRGWRGGGEEDRLEGVEGGK